MTTEAQKRASKKYYLKNKDYYRQKSRESIKNIRKERREYKARIDKALEYLDKVETLSLIDGKIIFSINIFRSILQGDNNE